MKIGLMGAIPEEVALLDHAISSRRETTTGGRVYTEGMLFDHKVVVVFSRIGKVAAAVTATTLIERFAVDAILFTGVAGAAATGLNVGDIVVADTLIQHDLDASALPAFQKFEVPLLGVSRFPADPDLVRRARAAAETFCQHSLSRHVTEQDRADFSLGQPRAFTGLIASGDQFIAEAGRLAQLLRELPELLCVEMEGAAVAQVCHEHGVPCGVIRTISDKADHSAPVDFTRFAARVAAPYSTGILEALLQNW